MQVFPLSVLNKLFKKRIFKIPLKIAIWMVFQIQKCLLIASYYLVRYYSHFIHAVDVEYSVVFGTTEISNLLHSAQVSVKNSASVNFINNRYYQNAYTFYPYRGKNRYLRIIYEVALGPILLGFLIHKTDNFCYLWHKRYLLHTIDEGEFEYRFIKNKNKNLILYFVGNDIRSPRKCMELARKRNDEVTSNYYYITAPYRLLEGYETSLKRRAHIVEKYADHIISASVDQASYLKSVTIPPIYFTSIPCDRLKFSEEKFHDISTIRILHAPSSPIAKGTQIVRASISRLKKDGLPIEYIECQDADNTTVLSMLEQSHCVINELYGLVPGVFGIEALATSNALFTAADPDIENDLPQSAKNAWVIVRPYDLYEKLKEFIVSPEKIKVQSKQGFDWFMDNHSNSVSAKKISQLLKNPRS